MKRRKKILALALCLSMCAAGSPAALRAEDGTKPGEQAAVSSAGMAETAEAREEGAEIVDSGTYQGIDWSLDTNGHLVLVGNEGAESDSNAPWRAIQYQELIISAEVKGNGWKSTNNLLGNRQYLKSVDLSNLDTSNVTDMRDMFWGCFNLTELDVSRFNTSNVTDMSGMFWGCRNLTELDVSSFDTSNVTSMGGDFCGMFGEDVRLTELNLNGFNTSNVTNMGEMFNGCRSLTELDLRSFDTSNVTNMGEMFSGCGSLTELDLRSFDTSNVTNMGEMFSGCGSLTELDLGGFNTSNVMDMREMFRRCESLAELDLDGFDTNNVDDMTGMFGECYSLKNLNISGFNTGNVLSMYGMFENCVSMEKLNISNFDTGSVQSMYGMFNGCDKLISLGIDCLDASNATDMRGMFEGCSKLSATLIIQSGEIDRYSGCFLEAATEPGSKIIVRYGGNCTKEAAEQLVATKSENSHVYLEGQEVTAASVTFDRTELTLKKEEITELIPTVTPIDAWEACLWTSDNPSIAVVDEEGIIMGVSEGRTTIRLTVGSASAECSVTVGGETAVRVSGIELNRKNATLKWEKGWRDRILLIATVTPEEAAYKKVIWSSSNANVATVDQNGLVVAEHIGETVITATTKDGKKQASCVIRVTEDYNYVSPEPGRVAGTSRYSTALECAERIRGQQENSSYITKDGKFSAVVVACADNFPDALAGSTLAALVKAPILLVGKNVSESNKTLEYLNENVEKEGIIYLLGGSGAIPEGTREKLISYGFRSDHIKILAGNSRYETNMKIVEELPIIKGSDIVIVSGRNYADSLSISGIAGRRHMPIFLAADILSEEAMDKIKEIEPTHIYIVGGTAAVSDDVFKQAETLCDPESVIRIAGASRYATSLAAAEYFGMEFADSAVFAYGGDFPDGLTGGAFAASLNAPVILVSDDNYKEQAEFLANSNIEYTYIMGGTSVISDETMKYLQK